MFKPHITKEQLSALIGSMSEVDFARFLYCQHMAATHLAIGQFENMLISAMWMCDRVKLKKTLGPDLVQWQRALKKHELLRGSTLGTLIDILSRHGVAESDIAYLRWLKGKRDYFVTSPFSRWRLAGRSRCKRLHVYDASAHGNPDVARPGREAYLVDL